MTLLKRFGLPAGLILVAFLFPLINGVLDTELMFPVIIGAPTLRLRGDYLAIVTLGFGEIIPRFFLNGDDILGYNLTNGTIGIKGIDSPGIPFGPRTWQ